MTVEQLKMLPSYDALKRNGLSDENIVQYYSLPIGQRGAFFSTFKNPTPQPTKVAKPTINFQTNDIDAIRDMALELMETTFTYRGVEFNAKQLGWRFGFNDRKRALGLCRYTVKKIELSQYFIENGSRDPKMWKNTMIHELAHAMNYWYYGGTGHDWRWRDIFMSWGGNGQRTSGDTEFGNLLENPVSKYTLVCDSCGDQRPSHKVKKNKSACYKCCTKHNGGRYSEKYVLRQVKNY